MASSHKLLKIIQVAMTADVPVLLWGEPGIGKTAMIQSFAKEDFPVEAVIASISEPAEIGGMPVVSEDRKSYHRVPPAYARNLLKAGKGIAFFDEISTAPPTNQAALLRVILEKVVGDTRLPDGVRMIAAANPPECATGGWELTAPLANRFAHIDVTHNVKVWCDGMIMGWERFGANELPIKDVPQNVLAQKRSLIASFIHSKPSNLQQLPKTEDAAGRAWPSPRSWDNCARILGACEVLGYGAESEVAAELMVGLVGKGAAVEFGTWLQEQDLPDPEELLKHPEKVKLPSQGDKVYTILSSVTTAVLNNNTLDRWKAAWKILAIAADSNQKDTAAMSATSLVNNRPKGFHEIPPEIRKFKELVEIARDFA